ncbi:hypothetical protein K413DRAFT_4724 [Clostridium sp. ASBs410]|nr:hypothetical protein K413DRAFT_4724 [Clostridium sp. ASBs410]
MLDKQIHMYSIDTGHFFVGREKKLYRRNVYYRTLKNKECQKVNQLANQLRKLGYTQEDVELLNSGKIEGMKYIANSSELMRKYVMAKGYIEKYKREAEISKKCLIKLLNNKTIHNIISNGRDHSRVLKKDDLFEKNIISVFESSLSRTIGLEKDCLTNDLMVVQIYYFDVFKDICHFGYNYNGEKYIYFTSSAGQIRTKKAVFIKESTYKKHEKTIMCGLSIDKINLKGGNNVNKHLAYTALSNSATDLWSDFDIDKAIVIEDFETDVFGTYDLINDEDYTIQRVSDFIPITHTDGAGMILSGKNKMCRLPWIKGLLGVFDFRSFILENNYSPIVPDIYGKLHDIIDEDIQTIFTKSQFKMWKYYDSWEQYKYYFKKYGCTAGVCNVEEDRIKNATINYQMLQTLTNVTDGNLEYICSKSLDKLNNICASIDGIYNVFGVTPYNNNMTSLQKAVKMYPNLLNDEYMKSVIRGIKDSLVKQYRAGRLEVEGKYTFILPDFYAACEYWFGNVTNPNGLLGDGEVFSRLFRNNEYIDCLRSPHLFKEHAVRKNVAYDEWITKKERVHKWFNTNAVYTSCKDLISKMLQFDVDGDKALGVADEKFIDIARENMNGIVPLYYNMRKAAPQLLSSKSIYNGLIAAFTGGNIGLYSNNISKIWNSNAFINGSVDEKNAAIDIVKILCMENNFCIDMAKTLYMPTRPRKMNKKILSFTRSKLPLFFKYAKDKTDDQVEEFLPTTVNRIGKLIKNPRLNFKQLKIEKPDYRLLMNNPYINIDEKVIETYNSKNQTYHFKINMKDDSVDNLGYISHEIKTALSDTGYSDVELCDMLVKYLYEKESKNKEALWFCYGDVIVDNLEFNLKPKKTKFIQCVDCGEWIEVDAQNTTACRCNECQKLKNRTYEREKKRKQRLKSKCPY